ncbi:MAG: SCO family protein [Chitinophagales bacterium]|nr:SCO family protein [Chitinophagales bacterium]MCZ2392384.1 SCO family protein [Chitinophagales bacterium]
MSEAIIDKSLKNPIVKGIILWVLLSSFGFPNENDYLGQKIANITVYDAKGVQTNLYSLIRNKPLILSPIYTKCYTMCGLLSNGVQQSVNGLGTLGKDFNIVSFSFDSTDTSEDLAAYEERWKIDGNHWKAISASTKEIQKLMASIGYEYDYNSETKEYAHPSILIVVTPSGKISRYIYGVNPKQKDIQLAVIEAMSEKTRPGIIKGFYLRCFGYDPVFKTYKIDWRFIISTSAGLLMIGVLGSILIKSFIIDKNEWAE